MCESVPSALAAFIGSCNSIRDLTASILSVDVDQFSFPDEEAAATVFSDNYF